MIKNIFFIKEGFFDKSLSIAPRLEIAKQCARLFDVKLVTSCRNEKPEDLNYTFIDFIPSSSAGIFNPFKFFQNFIKKYDHLIDECILYLDVRTYFLAFLLYKKYKNRNVKFVLDVRTVPVNNKGLKQIIYDYLFKKTLKFTDVHFAGITFITPEMRNVLKRKYFLKNNNIEFWSSGVNVDHFTPMAFKTNNEQLKILYHGSLSPYRGIADLIKAINIVSRDHNILLTLVGPHKEHKYYYDIIHRLNLEKVVELKDATPYQSIPKVINNHDIGVLPFPNIEWWNVSSPIKLFEYLACGKPVIATKIPAHTNVLDGKQFVFWAENSDAEHIADAILKAFHNRTKFTSMQNEAREFVLNNYTWEIQGTKLIKFLEKL